MPKKVDRSTVSVWSWFLTIFLIAIPCFGVIYVLVGAFLSPNENRRNFYRAHIAWVLIVVAFYLALFAAGMAPSAVKVFDQYRKEHGWGVSETASRVIHI